MNVFCDTCLCLDAFNIRLSTFYQCANIFGTHFHLTYFEVLTCK